MFVKPLDRSTLKVEYNIPIQRNLPWDGVVNPPFGSMVGVMAPGDCTAVDVHNEHEVVFVATGEGVLTAGDEKRQVAAGDLVYIPPNVTHTLENNALDGELVALFTYWDVEADVDAEASGE
jgi:methionyl-tRNA synthetase